MYKGNKIYLEICKDFDHASQHSGSVGSAAMQIVSRVADALHVPVSVLYMPDDPTREACVPDRNANLGGDLASDCAALIHAFRRISDLQERQRLLSFVQEAAERS